MECAVMFTRRWDCSRPRNKSQEWDDIVRVHFPANGRVDSGRFYMFIFYVRVCQAFRGVWKIRE